jgi:hypothetical protein
LGVLTLSACGNTATPGSPSGSLTPPPSQVGTVNPGITPPANSDGGVTPPAPIESRTPREAKVTLTGSGVPFASFAPTKIERSPFGTDILLINLENDKYRITCSVTSTTRTGSFTIGQNGAQCSLFEFGTPTVWGLAWASAAQATAGSFVVDSFGAEVNVSMVSTKPGGSQSYTIAASGDYNR